MKRVVVDASALAALAFDEVGSDTIARRLRGAVAHAPTLLMYELANVAWKKAQRSPGQATAILQSLADTLDPRRGIVLCPVDVSDAVLIARATGLTVYDASYLCLAGMLGADLVTLDEQLANVLAG